MGQFEFSGLRPALACPGKHAQTRDMTQHRPKRPRDINQLANMLVDESTGELPKPEPKPDARDPAAVALGLRGSSKGGVARAAKLTPEQRAEIARKAARKRWGGGS